MSKAPDSAQKVSTEEKIKAAAAKMFAERGFAGTRTRDIAEEAGINLALLNYYFRSKQKLFDGIMLEKLQTFFGKIAPIFTDTSSSLETKIELFVAHYTQLLLKNPELPLFVLSEIRTHPQNFLQATQINELFTNSSFVRQLKEKQPDVHPMHYLMSMLGMTVFPFITMPMLKNVASLNDEAFTTLMQERKDFIPRWMNALLEIPPKK